MISQKINKTIENHRKPFKNRLMNEFLTSFSQNLIQITIISQIIRPGVKRLNCILIALHSKKGEKGKMLKF